ncbi:hypothetical protein I553_4224 [Mycobacterium xenopi 4042]|uniref:Uncharacterized protein n=1 Tax=Mycobacterium xenopi 4042 TaxID=1299334 RepID=X8AEK3_MYCXE|nr:hypothetical protein I553_4224 [Mycobacterium xenopi 4042]
MAPPESIAGAGQTTGVPATMLPPLTEDPGHQTRRNLP